jgi:hypothetical protein
MVWHRCRRANYEGIVPAVCPHLIALDTRGIILSRIINLELDDAEKAMLVALLKRTTAADPFPL